MRRASSLLLALAAAGVTAARSEAQGRRCRVHEVVVVPPDAQVAVGAAFRLTAIAYDDSGQPCDNVPFTWSSSNANMAAVESDGIARGVTPGSVIITARTGVGAAARSGSSSLLVRATEQIATPNIPGFVPVRGRPRGPAYSTWDRQPDGAGPAEAILVEPARLVLVRGESRFLDYRAIRADGQTAARVPIVFYIDMGREGIASVDTLGLIQALGDTGTVVIKAVVLGQPRIQARTVRVEVRADSIRFSRTALSMQPGAVETLSLFIPAQSRAIDPTGLFHFRSSDPGVARVHPVQPIITAVGPGTARITTASALHPEIDVTVSVAGAPSGTVAPRRLDDPRSTAGFGMPPFGGSTDADRLGYARRMVLRLDSALMSLRDVFTNTAGAPTRGASAPAMLSNREKGRWARCLLIHLDLGTLGEAATSAAEGSRGPLQSALRKVSGTLSGLTATAECDNIASMIEAPDRFERWQANYETSVTAFFRDWYPQLRSAHEANRSLAALLNDLLPPSATIRPIMPLPPAAPTIGVR